MSNICVRKKRVLKHRQNSRKLFISWSILHDEYACCEQSLAFKKQVCANFRFIRTRLKELGQFMSKTSSMRSDNNSFYSTSTSNYLKPINENSKAICQLQKTTTSNSCFFNKSIFDRVVKIYTAQAPIFQAKLNLLSNSN